MNPEPKKKKTRGVKPWFYAVSLLVVAVLSIIGTLFVSSSSFGNMEETSALETEGVLSVSDTPQDNDFAVIQEAFARLKESYYQEVDDETLIEGAIAGMAEAVEDPYTEYLDDVESVTLEEDITGSFEGIGAEVMKEGEYVKVVSPIPGSPAEEAGLLPNDLVMEVDGKAIEGMSLNEAVALIRGEKGTDVVLTIDRGGQTFEVAITRDAIPVETVVYQLDETHPEIGHIQITNFSLPTYDELVEAVTSLREQGAKAFVFDVRGNPGGLLNSAIELSNVFVEEGKPLFQIQERDNEPYVYHANDELYGDFKVTEPSILLINEGSASASEILAAAMNESADIPLLGMPTFGKGTMQNVEPIGDGGELKITVGKWLTPSGKWVNEEGIVPTIEQELPSYVNLLLINRSKTYQETDLSVEVENIESILEALGYTPGTVDGYFDEQTTKAVSQFQQEENLSVDGIVTGDTANLLVERLRELIDQNDTQYDAAVEWLIDNHSMEQ
ncbi:S41 family peptidase [Atopococcus tabaci]|uniref:S41 family peptidase n=1 Tax=Atopococcus tabaci TaxID=269774 RepID=UPI0024099573|nr:S41 family peptidase [Atopococcus tabaci]